jgi:hypothetical protein
MAETRKLAAILAADVVGYSKLGGSMLWVIGAATVLGCSKYQIYKVTP